ncbi:MAG TPA: HEXXH motif-containing putative peptide modification protein [Streptosporangiaceae bacterium]|nr:HEXXH motif-containing putative peptide modification protein [Streptosporangiaceae bacterium]
MSRPLRDTELSGLARGIVTAETTQRLNAAQLAKHQILVETVRRRAARTQSASTVATLTRAVELLTEIQSQDPHVVDELLALPQIGSWAVSCLEGMRRGERPDADYLAQLAAGAAFRVGRECGPPADRNGHTFFPGLGVRDGTRWTLIPHLRVRAGELALSVNLDAMDPYLGMYGRRTRPNPREWRDRLTVAWRILVHRHRSSARVLAVGVRTLVPLAGPTSGPPFSGTSGWTYGAVATSLPDDSLILAETLIHEFQHLTLGAVEDLVALTQAYDKRLWYAPWREDPRPLSALLQGCYAFLGVTEFWREERNAGPPEDRRRAEAAFARWRRATFDAARTLSAADGLTATGRAFATGIRERLEPWMTEPVSPAAERYAARAGAEHRARWEHAHGDGHANSRVGRISRASARG